MLYFFKCKLTVHKELLISGIAQDSNDASALLDKFIFSIFYCALDQAFSFYVNIYI